MTYHKHRGRARGVAPQSQFDVFEQELTAKRTRHRRTTADHKTMQLCRQVERAIAQALAGECGDDLLRELNVEDVKPAGSASQLLVHLRVPADVSMTEAIAHIEAHSIHLRYVVAGAISRKRTPTLTYIYLSGAEGGSHA